jgi:hypothetical protein
MRSDDDDEGIMSQKLNSDSAASRPACDRGDVLLRLDFYLRCRGEDQVHTERISDGY